MRFRDPVHGGERWGEPSLPAPTWYDLAGSRAQAMKTAEELFGTPDAMQTTCDRARAPGMQEGCCGRMDCGCGAACASGCCADSAPGWEGPAPWIADHEGDVAPWMRPATEPVVASKHGLDVRGAVDRPSDAGAPPWASEPINEFFPIEDVAPVVDPTDPVVAMADRCCCVRRMNVSAVPWARGNPPNQHRIHTRIRVEADIDYLTESGGGACSITVKEFTSKPGTLPLGDWDPPYKYGEWNDATTNGPGRDVVTKDFAAVQNEGKHKFEYKDYPYDEDTTFLIHVTYTSGCLTCLDCCVLMLVEVVS